MLWLCRGLPALGAGGCDRVRSVAGAQAAKGVLDRRSICSLHLINLLAIL